MFQLEVQDPVAQQRGDLQRQGVSRRPTTLEGKTVGLLWNGFRNGDVALQRISELLAERFTDVRTNFYIGGHPAPPEVLKQAANECAVVVGAAAD